MRILENVMCKQNNLYQQFLKYWYYDLKELFKKVKAKEEQEKIIGKEIVENSLRYLE